MRQFRLIQGDCLETLRGLAANSANCCVTSPPYWGLRDYGVAGQLGLEPTPEEYIARLVAVFDEVRRVLREDGTCWLNLGDSFYSNNSNSSGGCSPKSTLDGGGGKYRTGSKNEKMFNAVEKFTQGAGPHQYLKPKDLCMVPARVALALQAAGWWLRSDIIWAKPNPMPESVTDRPTRSHEFIFLLTKAERYFWDQEAVRETSTWSNKPGKRYRSHAPNGNERPGGNRKLNEPDPKGRNLRDVWTVATHPFPEAHFATFPPALVEPCILAGCPEGGTVLDPFSGAGTTGLVALRLNRRFIGIELNPEYLEMARRRIQDDAPLFNEEVT